MSLTTLALPVYGMNCASCAVRLQTALNGIKGISAEVNFSLEKALIDFHSDADHFTTLTQIMQLIEKNNYQTDTQTFTFDVIGWSCVSCANKTEKLFAEHPLTFNVSSNFATETIQFQSIEGAFSSQALNELSAKSPYQLNLQLADNLAEQQTQKMAAAQKRHKKSLFMLSLSILLSLPFLYSMILMLLTGSAHFLPGYVEFLLATPIQFFIGARFYKGAWYSLLSRAANMDFLVALGTSAAYFSSLYILLSGTAQPLYFESSALVITLVSLGKYFEQRAKQSTSSAINALMALRPDSATIKKGKKFISVNIEQVQLGDIVQLAIGEKVPVDGIVIDGSSYVDESLITGESKPRLKTLNQAVIAGSINGEGMLLIKTTAVGKATRLSNIIQLVEKAQMSKAPIMQLVDKISAIFVPIVLIVAALTFLFWYLYSGDFQHALITSVAVLVIACPCALGLATPTAVVVGTGVAAQQGILIKDIDTLQQVFKLTTVVFDKTGTLTQGKGSIASLYCLDNNEQQMLAQLGGLQVGSKHPIANAIKAYCTEKNIAAESVTDITAIHGEGIHGKIDGVPIIAGNQKLFSRFAIDLPTDLNDDQTQSTIYIGKNGQFWGYLSISDQLRNSSKEAISDLQHRGLKTLILSGDKHSVVEHIAEQLSMPEFYSDLSPEQKLSKLIALQENGHVAMVGDGVNDAPALAQADISIAMGTGSDSAKQSASITLMRDDPRLVAQAIDISKATWKKIQQNLFWAFVFNTIAIPAAAFGYLSPTLAGAAMALSSISVLTNSLLLKRTKIKELL